MFSLAALLADLARGTVRHSVEGLRVAGWPTMVPSGAVDI